MDPEFAAPPLVAPEALRGTRILVVDDNSTARKALAAMLESMGLNAFAVSSAERAMAELERGAAADPADPYYAVLMDWRMPGLDGLQAAFNISKSENLPVTPVVIMVTVYEREEVMRQPNSEVLADCPTKPVNPSLLLDTLMNVFGIEMTRVSRINAVDDSGGLVGERLAGMRVLLVEDHEINQQIATEILAAQGVNVVVAANGEDAVTAVTAGKRFDAILMDLQMPVMDGFEATRLIRAKGLGLPIIAMTAHAMLEERQRCLDAGMNDHVAKPINPQQLFASLAKFVDAGESTAPAGPRSFTSQNASVPTLPMGLPGLEVASGLRRINGNAKLYLTLVRQFCVSTGAALSQIDVAVNQRDWDTVRQRAHSIAGAAGNIAANDVARLAKRLGKHCGADAGEKCRTLVAELQAAFATLQTSIAELGKTNAEEEIPVAIGPLDIPDAQSLAPALQKLAAHLSSKDLAAEDSFRRLKTQFDFSEVEELMDEIDADLETLRYPQALESLQRLAVCFAIDPASLKRER